MTGTNADNVAMHEAIRQAGLAAAAGEVPVGAVVTLGGAIVAAAHNRTLADNDPSGHAEIVALRAAGQATGNHRLGGATEKHADGDSPMPD